MSRPLVYIASPLGFAASSRLWYAEVLLPAVRAAGLEALDPWADADGAVAARFAEAAGDPASLAALNAELGARNAADIERAAGLLAVLDGVDVDSGTAAEIGYAAALGRAIEGLRTDTRTTGDNAGATVNLQVEHFIARDGGRIATEPEEALRALAERLR